MLVTPQRGISHAIALGKSCIASMEGTSRVSIKDFMEVMFGSYMLSKAPMVTRL